jgi:hypothetical protein
MRFIHLPTVIEATLFNAPEASMSLSRPEVRLIEDKYNVRMLSSEGKPAWFYGRISDPARSLIRPGDYIVAQPSGDAQVVSRAAFEHEYEPV